MKKKGKNLKLIQFILNRKYFNLNLFSNSFKNVRLKKELKIIVSKYFAERIVFNVKITYF
jgi:hypothetical protein